jgi:LPS sulfotransferase NodH
MEGRLVVVFGCARSGTTWLQQLLLAHPDVGGPDEAESWIFMDLHAFWSSPELAASIPSDRLAALLRRFCDRLFAAALERHRSGATLFVEKTPGHAQHLDEIASVYPDAWFVHIVRDGRDVARSLAEFEHGVANVRAGAAAWVATLDAVARSAPGLARFREIRYEDLVVDPVGRAAELLSWVGLDVDDEIRQRLSDCAGIRVSRFNTTGPVGPGKWRSLSRRDLAAVESIAGDHLRALGYLDERGRRGSDRARMPTA